MIRGIESAERMQPKIANNKHCISDRNARYMLEIFERVHITRGPLITKLMETGIEVIKMVVIDKTNDFLATLIGEL